MTSSLKSCDSKEPNTLSFWTLLVKFFIALTYSMVVMPTVDLFARDLTRKSAITGNSDCLSASSLVYMNGKESEPWKYCYDRKSWLRLMFIALPEIICEVI